MKEQKKYFNESYKIINDYIKLIKENDVVWEELYYSNLNEKEINEIEKLFEEKRKSVSLVIEDVEKVICKDFNDGLATWNSCDTNQLSRLCLKFSNVRNSLEFYVNQLKLCNYHIDFDKYCSISRGVIGISDWINFDWYSQ